MDSTWLCFGRVDLLTPATFCHSSRPVRKTDGHGDVCGQQWNVDPTQSGAQGDTYGMAHGWILFGWIMAVVTANIIVFRQPMQNTISA